MSVLDTASLGIDLNNLPLGWWAAVVRELRCRRSGVRLVVVQVRGQDVTRSIELRTCGLVVSRHDHVWYTRRDGVHPVLPEVPVRLVDDVHVATLRATLVGNLTGREGSIVLWRDGTTARKLGRGTVVAEWPGVLAREDARVPIVGVADIAAVPGEGKTVVNSLAKLLMSALCVRVAHVVQDRNAELIVVANRVGSLELHDFRGSSSIGRLDLVVVGCASLEVRDLNIVKELRALGDSDL
jgi:hypothetical protein